MPAPADADSLAIVIASNTITRPANTTAYASGDIVADSTTAASVTPFSFENATRCTAGSGRIERVRIYKSNTSTTNASFRVHFYMASPGTPANGDNGAWSTSGTNYVGACDVTLDRVFTDGAEGAGVPIVGSSIMFKLSAGTTLYALLEARAAYTPASGETFTLKAEVYRF